MATVTKANAKGDKPAHAATPTHTSSQPRSPHAPSSSEGLASFQQSAGNQAVQQLLNAGVIRAKLNISQPNDPDEQEADAVADRIMRMPDPLVKSPCPSCATGTTPCHACIQSPSGQIFRKANGEAKHEHGSSAQQLISRLGPGHPLGSSTRAFFEPRLGFDLSHVRIHADGKAADSARTIQARAYTLGSNVVFGAGETTSSSLAGGMLLAHELVHVAQQTRSTRSPGDFIQRQQAGGAVPTADQNPHAQTNQPPPIPRRGADRAYFQGVLLADDREFMKGELRRLIARGGLAGADEWHAMLLGWKPLVVAPPVPPAHLGATGAFRPRSPVDAQRKMQNEAIQHLASDVYLKDVRPEAVKFLEDFEKQAKANVESTLKANEEQAKAEAIRYGLTSQQIERIRYQKTGEGPSVKVIENETKYDMDKDSPAAAGLKNAAEVLLGRRHDIEKDREEQSTHLKWERDPYEPKGKILVPDEQYNVIGKKIEEKKIAYNNLRSFLSSQFPVLAGFSELDKGAGDLETLAKKGTGPDMAALIGQEIAHKYANINKVREGLKDGGVNVWRQPKMVDLTGMQFGAKDDPMKSRLVNDKVESEQPGILFDLALVVLNIAALLLAAPTGGASLVVAAGVNIVVTATHIQDYLMQSALSGTAFDKAQAISAEEPSLFWLAVEIVGTGLDVGPAAAALFKGFKTLAPLVKAAQTATKGEEAVKSLQAVRAAATDVKGAEVAEKIVAQVKNLQKGEAAVLEGAKITENELKLLQKAGKTAEEAAASGIGKGVKTATGEVNLSKSGHIFSCASPCTELGDKYAKIFAQGGEFNDDFVKLQKRARDVAQAEKAAKEAKDAKALATAEEAAEQIKKDAAALESRIHKAHPQLVTGAGDEAAATALKQAEAESAITKGRLSTKPDELEKLKPALDKPPAGVDQNNKLWKDYVGYFNDRLEGLKSGTKGVKPPLDWKEYSDFLGKFQRGTEYEEGVLTGLRKEAELAKQGKLAPAEQKLFQGMQDPIVESNVAVLEKSGKISSAGQPVHNFPDQLIVDGATIGAGKTPKVQALSNKSHIFDEWFKNKALGQIRSQVLADVEEAVSKYGGEITLKRPTGPLAELYNQTVKVEKVVLVYDAKLATSTDVQKIIRDAAKRPGVEVIFR